MCVCIVHSWFTKVVKLKTYFLWLRMLLCHQSFILYTYVTRDFPEHRVAVFLNQLKPSVASAPGYNIIATQQMIEEESDKVSSNAVLFAQFKHVGFQHFCTLGTKIRPLSIFAQVICMHIHS